MADAGDLALDVKIILNITLYISLVFLHTKYTGRRQNDFIAHGYR